MSRSPHRLRPRKRVILVVTTVSSIKTRRLGSSRISGWRFSIQTPRRSATSARSRSVAIRLDSATFTAIAAGNLDADAFRIGAVAADAEDRIIYNNGSGALLYDADGAGGAAAVQFATLGVGLALTEADFIIGP